MFATPPVLTEVGITILLRAAAGEEFTLTKFQVGDGILDEGETPGTMVRLKHLTLDNIPIIDVDDTTEDYLTLQGRFDNQTGFTEDFEWREIGLIAEDEDGREYLYAYAYNIDYPELIRAGGGSVMLEQYINHTVPVGDSGNITAEAAEQEEYALSADFNDHLTDYGDVSQATHHETYQQIGAAPTSHTHSALDVMSGILAAARGGTGCGSIAELSTKVGEKLHIGIFQGDARARQDITLGFKPRLVALFTDVSFDFVTWYVRAFSFWEGHNVTSKSAPDVAITEDANTMLARRMGGAAVTDNGFAVGYGGSYSTALINGLGFWHFYIALK